MPACVRSAIPLLRMLCRLLLAGAASFALASTARAEDLVIPGSGNPEYVLRQLAIAFNAQQSQHHVSVPTSSGTAGALRDVEARLSPLGRVGRPLKDEERARGLVYIPLGRDPVVFVAGAAVTTRNIGTAQAIAVFQGTTTNWSELGGKAMPIRVFGREKTDACRVAIARVITQFARMEFGRDVKELNLDPQLIAMLDRYPSSLAFLNRSALFDSTTRVAPLSFEGIEPSAANLQAGRYPLWIEFGLVRGTTPLAGAALAFVDYAQSPAGQRILREHGTLPFTAGH